MRIYRSPHLMSAEMCVTAWMASGARKTKSDHVIQHCIVLPRCLGRTQGMVPTGSERRHMTRANTEAIRRRLLHAVRMGLSIHFSCLLRACRVLHVVFRC